MTTTFHRLGLPEPIIDTLAAQGLDTPFPIQAGAIPDALAGRDVCGMAPTGSGKTLAFGLPMVTMAGSAAPGRPTALILTPTRELAAQIRKDLAPYGKAMQRQVFAVYGGVRYQTQMEWMRRGVDVLVATPGRLEDLITQGIVDLSDVAIVAVDEADRMADMGFLPSVRALLDRTRSDRQTLLFSATLDGDVGVLVREYQRNPTRHDAAPVAQRDGEATHHFWAIERSDKVARTAEIVRDAGRSIVFTRTRHGADRLARQLGALGVDAVAMHGGRTQGQRMKALDRLTSGDDVTLVATDVAARGIHVDDVSRVVHYDPPNGHKDYVHRSGRTARAGASGSVVSLVLDSERRAVGRIARELGIDGRIEVPSRQPLKASTPAARADQNGRAGRPAHGQRDDAMEPRVVEPVGRSAPSATSNPRQARLHVGNLPWRTTEVELAEVFGAHGEVRRVTVPRDRRGWSKGYGLVDMHVDHARRAVDALDGKRVGGRPITVKVSVDPLPKSSRNPAKRPGGRPNRRTGSGRRG
jgi:superfamily II DNA/RNA helicase